MIARRTALLVAAVTAAFLGLLTWLATAAEIAHGMDGDPNGCWR